MLSHSLRRFVGAALATLAIATAACGGGDGGDTTGPSDPGVPADVSGTYAITGIKTLGTLHGGGSGEASHGQQPRGKMAHRTSQ